MLDQDAVNLAKAIRQTETGNKPVTGASGETASRYQFMPETWKAWSKQYLGIDNAPITLENENKVAYSKIKELKDKGMRPDQIASIWNSGKPDYKGNVGVNSKGVAYDVPAYVSKVGAAYKTIKGTTLTPAALKLPTTIAPTADEESAQKYGAFFPANTKDPGSISEPAKAVGNLLPSAFNFVKGVIDMINPISTYNKIKEIYTGTKELADLTGGLGSATSAIAKELPGAAYESLVPEAGRGIVSAGGGKLKEIFAGSDLQKQSEGLKQYGEGLQTAQRAITNDPVGQILPFLAFAKGGVKAIDTIKNKAAMADYVKNISENTKNKVPIPLAVPKLENAFDTSISKVAAPVVKAGEYVFGGAKSKLAGTARYSAGQATGLQPETISEVIKTPKAFTKEAQATAGDRATLGQEIQSILGKKKESLTETSKLYEPIRQSGDLIKVSDTWLKSTIKDLTKLEFKNGKFKASGASVLRDAGDVRAMQHIYDLWQPEFKKGVLTAEKFLNFRTDLANIAKFEKQIGKSKPLESMAKIARGKFNEAFRPQIKGLDLLDKETTLKMSELKRLSKGLVDKDGKLMEPAINRIANATGKGKDMLIARLEETAPGITQKIKILKAIEDIQHASGIKVGAYTRSILTGGAFLSGILPGLITAILTSPELAVPLLRQYGLLKNSAAVKAVGNALRQLNESPNQTPAILKKEVNADYFSR